MAKRKPKPLTQYDFESISSDPEKAFGELDGIRFMIQSKLEEIVRRLYHYDTGTG